MRLCACLNVELDIIEPCGFVWNEKKIRQAGLDYLTHVRYERHESWQAFQNARQNNRIILMTTQGALPYTDFTFKDTDILLAGRESAGVPQDIHDNADGRILIPMKEGLRSLNIVNASAMILGEALRQTRWA